jgi:hypothetical protein
MWNFVMDKSGAGAGILRELQFPLPIYIPCISPQSSSLSPEAGTIGQEWPQCQIASQTRIKKKHYHTDLTTPLNERQQSYKKIHNPPRRTKLERLT